MPHAETSHLSPHDTPSTSIGGQRAADLPLAIGALADEWSPQLQLPCSLWEMFSSAHDAAGEALALAFAQNQCADAGGRCGWLWVQDAGSICKGGRPYLHGLPACLRSGLIHVEARNAADALWAMEEGVRCGALSFVIGEIAGDPRSLDFTATRRLVLAAERHGVPLYLLRRNGFANLSAARLRWRVKPMPSSAHRWSPRAPGPPRVVAELFRGRGLKPGSFTLTMGTGSHEPGDRLALVPELCDRPMESQRSRAG